MAVNCLLHSGIKCLTAGSHSHTYRYASTCSHIYRVIYVYVKLRLTGCTSSAVGLCPGKGRGTSSCSLNFILLACSFIAFWVREGTWATILSISLWHTGQVICCGMINLTSCPTDCVSPSGCFDPPHHQHDSASEGLVQPYTACRQRNVEHAWHASKMPLLACFRVQALNPKPCHCLHYWHCSAVKHFCSTCAYV